MSSSSRTTQADREQQWKDLMGTVDNAHATILENIKGFEALKDGNYAVFEKFAFLYRH
jgi:hypothetical protein